MDSVSRFGKISPLCQQKCSLWQSLEGSFSLWQNFDPTWANVYGFGQIIIVEYSKIWKK